MQKFIYKTLAFITTLILSVFFAFIVNMNFANFLIGNENKTVIVGHSHSQCAFNDSLIPRTKNLSQSDESYFYTYFKVKRLINQNPHINHLLIEFSNNAIELEVNKAIWGDDIMYNRFPLYAPFMDYNSVNLLYENNSKAFVESIGGIIRTNFEMLFFKRLNYTERIGGYNYLERNLANSLVNNLSSIEQVQTDHTTFPYENIYYLKKTINYASLNGVKVYLIRSPIHEKWPLLKNEKHFQRILHSEFSSIDFLDFSNFPLSNEEFGDLNHLNYKGAIKFSQWFSSILEEGLFEKKGKQEFINKKIKEYLVRND